MREGREVILESKKYASESLGLSYWHLLSSLAVFGVLAALIAVSRSLLVILPASFLLGLSMVRIFVLYHDSEHGTIFQGSRPATYFLKFCGMVGLNPPSIWRRSHDHHHRNNAKIYGASIGSYPMMTRKEYLEASLGSRIVYAISRHPLTIAFGYLTIFLYGMCLRPFLMNPKSHWDSGLSIALHISIISVLYMIRPELVLYLLVIPCTVSSALGAYLFYAQHNFPAIKLRGRENWNYFFAAMHSSSFIRMGPILRWFTGNIGFHHVHHLNARIPFYRLPKAMADIEELQSPKETSLGVRDVWQCFQMKLWDPEADRMITFREAASEPVSNAS